MNPRPDEALCQYDPELWFPPEGGLGNEARAFCRRCPLIQPCLEAALHLEPAVEGIWAATSFKERIAIRAERGIRLARNHHRVRRTA